MFVCSSSIDVVFTVCFVSPLSAPFAIVINTNIINCDTSAETCFVSVQEVSSPLHTVPIAIQ